ncbi:MAG TPA: sigma factor-like helix-turn-helix DNA-binding protein [Candidatus Saccharimonadales bacterium]|nr:sigma factor-like helix-turn-helix DNA-binding protein [Candidatus Saccharimonadales bacterium]
MECHTHLTSLDSADPEATLLKSENRRVLAAAVARLSEPHRRAIQLFYLGGLNYEEAAQMEGIGMVCFKSRLDRARRQLFQLLKASDLVAGEVPDKRPNFRTRR